MSRHCQALRSTLADGKEVTIETRTNPRAKQMILRLDTRSGQPVLTLPPNANRQHAQRFLDSQRDFLARQLARRPTQIRLAEGVDVPVHGVLRKVRHDPERWRQVALTDQDILVGGPKDLIGRRLERWLRDEARRELTSLVNGFADRLGVTFSKIMIKDTSSRWGSCSSSGVLSFSWRIIMAPPEVAAYLAAHEVAHLRQMNHSREFWRHVEALVDDHGAARKWLRANGARLFSYQA